MDPNGQRFYLLAREEQFRAVEDPPQTDFRRSTLRLASRAAGVPAIENVDAAIPRLELVPEAADGFGTRARYDAAHRQIVATGAGPGEIAIWNAPAGVTPTDLALGHDGVLYIALEAAGKIILNDRNRRWPDAEVTLAGFKPWRLAAHPDGGVWALDRATGKLARLQGLPLRPRPYAPYASDVFRPVAENSNPPRLDLLPLVGWTAPEQPVGLTCAPDGTLALLSWSGRGDVDAAVRFLDGERLSAPVRLNGAKHPYSITCAEPDRLAVLLAGWAEAAVYPLRRDASSVNRLGDLYPLQSHDGGPFLHVPAPPGQYPTSGGGVAALNYLSLPSYESIGHATAAPFDSGDPRTVWDRLYLEAAIPPHTEIRVLLAAGDTPTAPADDSPDWFPHRFGGLPDGNRDVPRGVWLRQQSELSFQPSMLPCAPKPGQSGLFTALVQRAGRRVRALRGRYLFVRLELKGDTRSSPELAALRVYASRFSYRDRYLPRLYRETVFGPDADALAASTPADFLERFLANFEGILTPIEDRIRHADLLTDARSTPEEALPWLGSFIGFTFDAALPAERCRALLQNAAELYRRRGTLHGLELLLDLTTGGMIGSGQIVVLEDWRMRRTFATILGANLEVDDDPLLPGLITSGNSYVGDTLFLGDETQQEFLALFRENLTGDEATAVEQLFDRTAHRVTVFVHQDVDADTLALIGRTVEAEKPAHVLSRVVTSSSGFIIGLASLLGVETTVADAPPPQSVTLDQSRLDNAFLQHPASLDPRLGNGWQELERPVPVLGRDLRVTAGASFTLDATGSFATPGESITTYHWTLLNPK